MSKNPDTSTEKRKKKEKKIPGRKYRLRANEAGGDEDKRRDDDDFGLPAASRAPGVNFTIA